MNNGDFNNGNNGSGGNFNGMPGQGAFRRPVYRKSIFPTAILIMSFLGILSPSWSVTAIVCGAIDRHLSGEWNGKTRAGVILSACILGFYALLAVMGIVSFLIDPNLSSTILEAFDTIGNMTGNYGYSPFM